MKRCINIDTQIVVSTQLSTDHLPKEFNYTCFFWLPNYGIFKEYSMLVACGTQEGSIVIIGKKDNIIDDDKQNISNSEFVYVSLLPGHEAAITDICVLNKLNLFLSISKDSKVCGWSCQDCTCEFQINLNLNYGTYFFSLYPIKVKYIWITRYGESIFLMDISKGVIIKQFPYPGIQSFELICPHPNLKNSPVYGVCVGSIQTTIYLIENKCDFIEQKTIINEKSFEYNKIVEICQFGIIKIAKNQFEIIDPISKFETLYHGNFSELPDDDFIKSISFNHSRTLFAAASFFGRFFIVNLKNGLNSISIEYISPFSKPTFASSKFSINDQQEVIFSSNSKTIYFINDQKRIEKVKFRDTSEKVNNKILDVYHMNGIDDPTFFTSHDNILSLNSTFSHKPFRTIQFQRRITAIFERKTADTNEREIVVGFDNGIVCFYSTRQKYVTVLTAAVECFISLISKIGLIAIGRDGSACLIKEDYSYFCFETPLIPITNVHYIPYVDLYSFGFDNGSFLIYSTNGPTPIEISMKLPDKAKKIWPKFVESGYSNEFSSSFITKNVAYEVVDVPNLYDVVRSNFFQFQRDRISDSKKQKKVNYLIDLCISLFDLMENEPTDRNGSNLALIGANDQPTFFYESFRFDGEKICDL